MSGAGRPDLLAAIVAATARRIETDRSARSLPALEREAASMAPDAEAFRVALARTNRVNVIAECKRRSPSRGVLRADYDPVLLARTYAGAGAAAISVLTEPAFFDGALDHLVAVRNAVTIPLLRKDFVIDEYQLLEARAAGADAVLLIVAALDDPSLARLQREAAALGLATLVEVHDTEELARALDAGARIVGVNNRNLRTLEVDLRASHDVAACLPPDVIGVSESGLRSSESLAELRAMGYQAFLIGERLMTSGRPAAVLESLVAGRVVSADANEATA